MPYPKNPHRGRPFWCRSETTTPSAEHLWRELQTKGSTRSEAMIFDGFTSTGAPRFRVVPHRRPRYQ